MWSNNPNHPFVKSLFNEPLTKNKNKITITITKPGTIKSFKYDQTNRHTMCSR